jgi:TPR repeat protein
MLLRGEGGDADLPRARALLERGGDSLPAAGKGDLADMLRKGLGGPADPEKARKIYEALVAGGATWQAPILAEMLREGEGGPRDPERARKLLETAVAGGAMWVAGDLAEMMRAGEGGKPDLAGARSLLSRAVKQGEKWTVEPLAYMVRKSEGGPGGQPVALQLLRREAAGGNVVASRVIGDFCMWTRSGRPDFACAMREYEKAARAGDRDALASTAQLYLDPRRGPYRTKEALGALRKYGSEAGLDQLLARLSQISDNGLAVLSQIYLKQKGLYSGSVNGMLTASHLKAIGTYCTRSRLDCRSVALSEPYRQDLATWILNGKDAL